jgi:transcriptional regulator with XRE-family HTH domain
VNDQEIYKKIGSKVRFLRESRNLSQEYIAHQLGYRSRVTVSKIESGDYTVTAETLKKLSDIFQVPLNTFLSEDERKLNTKELVETLLQDKDLSPADIDKIIEYINFLKQQHRDASPADKKYTLS